MATVVKCDNIQCDALFEVDSFLGGHTFTCNQCGSRVTIRDLSYIATGDRRSSANFGSRPQYAPTEAESRLDFLDPQFARHKHSRRPVVWAIMALLLVLGLMASLLPVGVKPSYVVGGKSNPTVLPDPGLFGEALGRLVVNLTVVCFCAWRILKKSRGGRG